jgi:hypothetical protein
MMDTACRGLADVSCAGGAWDAGGACGTGGAFDAEVRPVAPSVETTARSPQKSKGCSNRFKVAHAFEKRLCLHALWGSQNPEGRGFASILARKEFVPRRWSPSNFHALEYLCLKQRTKACRLHSCLRGATDTKRALD